MRISLLPLFAPTDSELEAFAKASKATPAPAPLPPSPPRPTLTSSVTVREQVAVSFRRAIRQRAADYFSNSTPGGWLNIPEPPSLVIEVSDDEE